MNSDMSGANAVEGTFPETKGLSKETADCVLKDKDKACVVPPSRMAADTGQTAASHFRSRDELWKLSKSLNRGIKPENKMFCDNTNCSVKTNDLVDAPTYALFYFGFGDGNGRRWKICRNCLLKAQSFNKRCKDLVRNKENLFSLKCEVQSTHPDLVIDLDQEAAGKQICERHLEPVDKKSKLNDADAKTRSSYSVSINRLDWTVEMMLKKFKLSEQVKKCMEITEKETDQLGIEMASLDKQMDSTMVEITSIVNNYNSATSRKTIELGTADIDQKGICEIKQSDNLNEQLKSLGYNCLPKEVVEFQLQQTFTFKANETEAFAEHPNNLRVTARKSTKASALEKSFHNDVVNNKTTDFDCQEVVQKMQNVNVRSSPQSDAPTCIFKFEPPEVNKLVRVMHGDLLNYWVTGRVTSISTTPPFVYTVQLHQTNSVAKISKCSGSTTVSKTFFGKQVAFMKPVDTLNLPKGTRVIAKFNDLMGKNPEINGLFYAGIVAESRSQINNNRYLIFFDDGYSQYSAPCNVIPVVEPSTKVWEDVHVDMKDFIQEYMTSYKNRNLLPAKVGDRLQVEFIGSLVEARVVDLDCSLVKVKYLKPQSLEYEWIYRGSERLQPINSLKNSPLVKAKTVKSSLKADQVRISDSSLITKSLAAEVTKRLRISLLEGNSSQSLNTESLLTLEEYEYAGSTHKILVPQRCPTPRKFQEHNCSATCAHAYLEDEFKGVSPLVIPFYLGWAREIGCRKTVIYISPCGRRFLNYDAIHAYNLATKTDIPIEFFSLEAKIDCLNEFKPLRQLSFIKDISYGKEWTPIQCVNSLDYDTPDYVDYLRNRKLGQEVVIDEDDGFMVCCDCKDDCKNKENCACWKMTLAGKSFDGAETDNPRKGYEHRRLKHVIESGIYECNQKCKCNQRTCLNRVVQNKVKWPVQVFKTLKKGWGVRALHDIPCGSFLCVYTGQLLNDTCANEEGLQYGDEYLADLDYVEVVESLKEGYESYCTDIDDEDNDAENLSALKRSRKKKSLQFQIARKSTSSRIVKKSGCNSVSAPAQKSSSSPAQQIPYRKYFGKQEKPYIIDGKRMGNFGRYFNHSCDPNVFIQSVFVDTHDLRFPWVAFFTKKDVKAGTELCWDYNYVKGSVPGKSLFCYCGADCCRKRLL